MTEAVESDFTKLPKDIVLELINLTNSSGVTVKEVSLGVPYVFYNEEYSTNTALELVGKQYQLDGKLTVYYSRVELEEILVNLDRSFPISGPCRLSSLMKVFNDRYGVNLQPEDYVDQDVLPLTRRRGEVFKVPLIAKPDSYVWIGSTEIEVYLG